MARGKATVTLDRAKLEEARALIGAGSMSTTIDIALDRLIRAEHLRRDIQAYVERPLTDDELTVADLPVELDLGDDDVDYDTLYRTDR
jgi:hypothetical protein